MERYTYDAVIASLPSLILMSFALYAFMLFLVYFRRDQKKKEIQARRRYTQEFCLNDDYEYYNRIFSHYSRKKYFKSEEHSGEIYILLNRLDAISIGVQNEVYDELIIRAYYAKYFVHALRLFKYVIKQQRDIASDYMLFLEFEKMAERYSSEIAIGGNWNVLIR